MKTLKWKPRVNFKGLAKMMTEADWAVAKRERAIAEHDRNSRPEVACMYRRTCDGYADLTSRR
jgi:hypothetical protein